MAGGISPLFPCCRRSPSLPAPVARVCPRPSWRGEGPLLGMWAAKGNQGVKRRSATASPVACSHLLSAFPPARLGKRLKSVPRPSEATPPSPHGAFTHLGSRRSGATTPAAASRGRAASDPQNKGDVPKPSSEWVGGGVLSPSIAPVACRQRCHAKPSTSRLRRRLAGDADQEACVYLTARTLAPPLRNRPHRLAEVPNFVQAVVRRLGRRKSLHGGYQVAVSRRGVAPAPALSSTRRRRRHPHSRHLGRRCNGDRP